MELRHPQEVSFDCHGCNLTMRGRTCTVTRGGDVLATDDAPFHAAASASNALPTYDTHLDAKAADCLAALLPHCDLVALVVMDNASDHWSQLLTNVLQEMGARHVPPAYRASWAFLWRRTPSGHRCAESYKLARTGPAVVEDIEGAERFHLSSAGWHDGYTASITIDGENILAPRRGVNAYVRGCTRPDIRHFAVPEACSNFIHQCAEGSHVVVATGLGKTSQYKCLPPLLYDNFTRLGGTGRVLSPSEVFILAGHKITKYPSATRAIPKEIAESFAVTTAHTGYAYTSLFFGDKETFLSGALVLVESLKRNSPEHERILLVSEDVPVAFRKVLAFAGWTLKDVPYLYGAYSLSHVNNVKFPPEIFMKLHIFDPALLPYEKVLFLDLDTIVRADISYLFGMPAPAAVSNWKDNNHVFLDKQFVPGEVMDPKETSFNAGVILVSPNKMLFDALVEDVATPAKHHITAWTPEQSYLGVVLAGYLRHLLLEVNFEVQLHGGNACSRQWSEMLLEQVKVVHYSGDKPWSANPHDEVVCCQQKFDDIKKIFRCMPQNLRRLATRRAVDLAQEWHEIFECVMQQLHAMSGADEPALPIDGIVPGERVKKYLTSTMIEK